MEVVSCCVNLVEENERLLHKVSRLRDKVHVLKNELSRCQSQLDTSSCIHVSHDTENENRIPSTTEGHDDVELRLHQLEAQFAQSKSKLLAMHNNTTRLYHAETKKKQKLEEQVTELETDKHDLEEKLDSERKKVLELERQLASHMQQQSSKHSQESILISQLKATNSKLTIECHNLRRELQAFDPQFFEEIEDLKYSLKKANELNVEYEKSLKSICKHYKIPFVKSI